MKKTMKLLFMAICLLAAPLEMSAQTLVFHLAGGAKSTVVLPATFTVTPMGDKLIIDGGGSVVELAKDDVMCVTYHGKKGDVNEDETVDVADIATIISIMAGKGGDDDQPSTGKAPKDVVAVDLGLLSGTKWANMNVGAEKPEDYGLFFAWGETVGYTSDTSDGRSFNWASYKWIAEGKSEWMNICKYQVEDGHTEADWYQYLYALVGRVFVGDRKTVLDTEDDAAAANWGGDWRMPTYEDYQELLANTTGEWTTFDGVSGYKFTSTVDGYTEKFIFLPAAGVRDNSSLGGQSAVGYYWSASVDPSVSGNAGSLFFDSGSVRTSYYGRAYGFPVRPVLRN